MNIRRSAIHLDVSGQTLDPITRRPVADYERPGAAFGQAGHRSQDIHPGLAAWDRQAALVKMALWQGRCDRCGSGFALSGAGAVAAFRSAGGA